MESLYSLPIEHVNVNLRDDNAIWTLLCRTDLPILRVNFSHVCIIYADIFDKCRVVVKKCGSVCTWGPQCTSIGISFISF